MKTIEINSPIHLIIIEPVLNFIQISIFNQADSKYITHFNFKKYNEKHRLNVDQINLFNPCNVKLNSKIIDLLIEMDIIKATKESFCITDHILLQLL
jgi:hypothetical protein